MLAEISVKPELNLKYNRLVKFQHIELFEHNKTLAFYSLWLSVMWPQAFNL